MRIGDRALRILGHMIWEGGWECIYLFPVGDLTLPYPTLPYPSLPYPTLPYPTLPYPTLPYPTLPYPTLPYPTLPYPFSIPYK